MIATIIAFVESPGGKILTYLIAALVGAGTLLGVYFLWKHEIEQAALANYNAAQLQKTLKDTQEQLKKDEVLFKLQQATLDALTKQREDLDKKLSGIDEYIAHASGDRPSSDIIKGTLQRLGAPN
jgi:uncharacterized protein HemX